MPLDPIAYAPYSDPDDFIREVTDKIWVRRSIGHIRDNYEPDSIVHGSLGTMTDRADVIEGTTMRINSTPNRVGRAEDVVWEARGDDAFLSSHLVLSTDLQDLRFRSRGIANCLYRRGRMVEEWVVGDTLAIAHQLGRDPDAIARQQRFTGFTGSMQASAPEDPLTQGGSGVRPDDHRDEAQHVLNFIDTVWNDRELDRVEEFCIRDLVLNAIDDRTIVRPEGYRRALLRMLSPFPGGTFDIRDVATHHALRYAGTRVSVCWRYAGVYNGTPTYGVPTDSPVEILGISQFLVQDGLITKETAIYDDIAIRTQIANVRGDGPERTANIY